MSLQITSTKAATVNSLYFKGTLLHIIMYIFICVYIHIFIYIYIENMYVIM